MGPTQSKWVGLCWIRPLWWFNFFQPNQDGSYWKNPSTHAYPYARYIYWALFTQHTKFKTYFLHALRLSLSLSLSLSFYIYIYIYISNLNSPSLSSLNLIFSLSPLDFASFSQLVHLDWCGGLVMELPYGL